MSGFFLEKRMVDTCEIVNTIRNKYGDYVLNSTTTEPCRFREITTTRRETHREINDADAQIWLKSNTIARIKSVIKYRGVYYQVERINEARRLGETTVQFVKCDLKIIELAVS